MNYKSISLTKFFDKFPVSSKQDPYKRGLTIYESPYIIPTYIEIAYDHLNKILRLRFRYFNNEEEYEEKIDNIKIFFGKNSKKIQAIHLDIQESTNCIQELDRTLNNAQKISNDSIHIVKTIFLNTKIRENIEAIFQEEVVEVLL